MAGNIDTTWAGWGDYRVGRYAAASPGRAVSVPCIPTLKVLYQFRFFWTLKGFFGQAKSFLDTRYGFFWTC